MLLYEGTDSFLEEVIDFKKAKYVILPVPMDITTTYLKGTKFGPRSVIEASRSLENYDSEMDFEVRNVAFTAGELEIPPEPSKAIEIVRKTVSDVLIEGKFPILLGGEHTITYGASLAFDGDVIFVIFDAHADFKKDVLSSPINHASNARLISKKNKAILIGIRSLSLEDKAELEKSKIQVVYSNDSLEPNAIGLKSALTGKKVYISIDMDVFDPAFAPGVGTPQSGGLSYSTVKKILETVVASAELVGFDVTETRPIADNNITEILAAKLVIDIIALNEKKKKS